MNPCEINHHPYHRYALSPISDNFSLYKTDCCGNGPPSCRQLPTTGHSDEKIKQLI